MANIYIEAGIVDKKEEITNIGRRGSIGTKPRSNAVKIIKVMQSSLCTKNYLSKQCNKNEKSYELKVVF